MESKYGVQVRIYFRYGHRLIAPYEGHCSNVHGEYGCAICFFEDEALDPAGMLLDFKVVKAMVKKWIDDNWDHSYLHHRDDDVGKYLHDKGMRTYDMGEVNPTAENMAECLYHIIKFEMDLPITRVGIVESSEDSIAFYRTK